jgi:hypothetical protein
VKRKAVYIYIYIFVQGKNLKFTGLKFFKHCPLVLLLKVSLRHWILIWIHVVPLNLVHVSERNSVFSLEITTCYYEIPCYCSSHSSVARIHNMRNSKVLLILHLYIYIGVCVFILYVLCCSGWFICLSMQES